MKSYIKNIMDKKIFCCDGDIHSTVNKFNSNSMIEIYNFTNEDFIYDIYDQYIKAGSDIITTNTYNANRLKLKDTKYSVEDTIKKAVHIAKKAAEGNFVALSIGPLGYSIDNIGFDEAYDIFKEQVVAGFNAGADIILIENMTDIYETKCALLAAKENCNLPVFCMMNFNKDGKTEKGTDAKTMAIILEGLGANAIGVNYLLENKNIEVIISELIEYSNVPIIAKMGFSNKESNDANILEFIKNAEKIIKLGVSCVGGFLNTTPEHIRLIKDLTCGVLPLKREVKHFTAACTFNKTVIFDDNIKIIGERINPTNREDLSRAIRNNDIDFIVNDALSQEKAGADIIDVNVSLPDINEKEFIIDVIKKLQVKVSAPLQIDSANIDIFERALRISSGKPIINSVNGKINVMEKIFPIAKKYGALLIALTLDEKGIPKKAEDRFAIAKNIIEKAKEYGIPKENILIDCLVLAAAFEQEYIWETFRAVEMVKKELKVRTILGISNISYGFPNREVLNRTYLSIALSFGLDAAIINPLNKDVMDTIYAFNVLANRDEGGLMYINNYKNQVETNMK